MTAVLFTPVPEILAWSSLGFCAASEGLSPCETAMLPEDLSQSARSSATHRRLSDFDVVFVSVAWELEVPVLARALAVSGIAPGRAQRPSHHPLVVAGGPLTRSNPDLLAACADAVFLGEADAAFGPLVDALEAAADREDALRRLSAVPGCWVPQVGGVAQPAPSPVFAPLGDVPLHSPATLPPNRFGGAFLVEVGRGCPRSCAFCVARTGTAPARFSPAERILAAVPDGVGRVGLLGAAVSDHPHLLEIVQALADRGVEVTLGSIRADRATPELLGLLATTGLRTLTVAADGASDALRAAIRKDIDATDLLAAADAARGAGLHRLRLYAMVGLPDETDADLVELCDLLDTLASPLRVAVSVSPFVPKRFTPLADAPFLPVRELKRRLAWLRRRVGGHVQLRITSPREAALEYRLSHVHGGEADELVRGWANGADMPAWSEESDR